MIVPKSKLIAFVNLVNECCAVMKEDYVGDWLNKPNPDLNMDTPLDVFNHEGSEGANKIYRLLYFIDIGEADL